MTFVRVRPSPESWRGQPGKAESRFIAVVDDDRLPRGYLYAYGRTEGEATEHALRALSRRLEDPDWRENQ